ncbi:hypothetical protein L483_08615 [Pseudomonas putida H8234]|nr:hypothetical protein L483_08615 [Pseudomonas putida H8234]
MLSAVNSAETRLLTKGIRQYGMGIYTSREDWKLRCLGFSGIAVMMNRANQANKCLAH